MRIPTITQNQRQVDTITSQSSTLSEITTKINTGKNLINSSDDPILSLSIKASQNYLEKLKSYENTTVTATNRITEVENSITSSLDIVQRVYTIVSQASSDTNNNTDRINLAKEMRGLLTTLANNVNKQDANGNYIFSGTRSEIPPFAKDNGEYKYMGSLESVSINISDYNKFIFSDSGQKPFGEMKIGNGVFSIGPTATPNLGTAETSVGAVVSQSAYIEDTYTISFVTNTAGNTAYQIVGATTGQVIPAPPDVTPDDAPDYKEGETIMFNGINLSIKGTPVVGDGFVIEPAKKQNILETINKTIAALETPVNNDVEKAAFHQTILQLSSTLSQASDHLTHYLTEVGYRRNEVDTQSAANSKNYDNQMIVLGALSYADPVELISMNDRFTLSLKMANANYVKMQQLFSDILRNSF